MGFFDNDDDGDMDFLWSYSDENSTTQRLAAINNGSGGFSASTNYPTTSNSYVALVDFDGDGLDDIFNYRIENRDRIYYWQRNIGAEYDTPIDVGEFTYYNDFIFSDYDSDGDMDLLYFSDGDNNFSYVENQGSSFAESRVIIQGRNFINRQIVDIDDDGLVDIISYQQNTEPHSIVWNKNLGNGVFDFYKDIITSPIEDFYTVDYDHDGDIDIITVKYNNDTTNVLLVKNLGEAVFDEPQIILTFPMVVEEFFATDFDSDGDYDFLYFNYNTDQFSFVNIDFEGFFVINSDNTSFSEPIIFIYIAPYEEPDYCWTGEGTGYEMEPDPNGTFEYCPTYFSYRPEFNQLLYMIDTDGDQNDDSIAINLYNDLFSSDSYLYKYGEGNFNLLIKDEEHYQYVSGDFDADGVQDILAYINRNSWEAIAEWPSNELPYNIKYYRNDGFGVYNKEEWPFTYPYTKETYEGEPYDYFPIGIVFDSNNDGIIDIFNSDRSSLDERAYYKILADGTYRLNKTNIAPGDTWNYPRYEVADIDNDGDIDFLYTYDGFKNGWYENLLDWDSNFKAQIEVIENQSIVICCPSRKNYTYQLEQTTDMLSWSILEEPKEGLGSKLTWEFSSPHRNRLFRICETLLSTR